jgi:threonine dehydrogenase-like Zn-dependent dehydrogenase
MVPEHCDDDAAAMTQPLAVALHALSRVTQRVDEDVAVIGVGGIGSFIVAGASHRAEQGRVVAVDIDDGRLSTAATLGADQVVNASGRELGDLLLEITDGVGFDVVIEATGAPHAPAAAIAGARRGGRVLLVGLHGAAREIELTPMIKREVDVYTTVAHICDADIPAALDLLSTTDIARLTVGPRIPLDALVEDGLRPLAERRATGKIVVTPA